MEQKVNAFIIGAPKCGTTSMASYLKDHPGIDFSKVKEPHFFSTDIIDPGKLSRVTGWDEYLGLFCFKNAKLHIEASTSYLHSKDAIGNILKHNSDAKLIVILRNPVDRALSAHGQKCKTSQEDEMDFKKAWYKQEQRKKGELIPKLCTNVEGLFYKERCSMGKQIERLFQQVPRSQCKIIFFEDFISDTKRTYQEVLDFLDLDYDGRTDFKIYNQRRECRNPKLDEFRVRLIRYAKRNVLVNKVHKFLSGFSSGNGLGINRALMALNYTKAKPVELDEEFRKELISEFYDDICLLEKHTGRDLSHWKK